MHLWQPDGWSMLLGFGLCALTIYGLYTVNRKAVTVNTTSWLSSAEHGVSHDVKLAEGEAEKIGAAIAAEVKKL
jgi:hypothetical protein